MNTPNRALSSPDSVEEFKKEFTSLGAVRVFLLEIFTQIAQGDIEIAPHYNDTLKRHPWYKLPLGDKTINYKTDAFDITYGHGNSLTNALYSGIQKFFKNGLKDPRETFFKNTGGITLSFCELSSKTLEEIESGSTIDALGFTLQVYLKPRYLKDGDSKKYSFRFEIKRKVDALGQSYFGTLTLGKSKVETQVRDSSVERSREAYRNALMRVIYRRTY